MQLCYELIVGSDYMRAHLTRRSAPFSGHFILQAQTSRGRNPVLASIIAGKLLFPSEHLRS